MTSNTGYECGRSALIGAVVGLEKVSFRRWAMRRYLWRSDPYLFVEMDLTFLRIYIWKWWQEIGPGILKARA